MKKTIVFNYSEISLKKKNRKYFEEVLFNHIKRIADFYGLGKSYFLRGRFYIIVEDERKLEMAIDRFKKVFGLKSIFYGFIIGKDLEEIKHASKELVKENWGSFKVKTKRADKKYFLTSMEISREIGAYLLENCENLTVDVHNPEFEVIVEIHQDFVFVLKKMVDCFSGLPYGTAGRVVSLLSGGIDSPVATWMMMKRGCEVIPVHFHTPPYTGLQLKEKVTSLVRKLSYFSSKPIKLHMVNFTDIQIAIKRYAADKFVTILSRRFMLRIAQDIAQNSGALAIVTGDALGQVASQTLENIMCINEIVSMPVFRPLIGFDKDEIEQIAKKIGTYEISIEEGIDCCHLFSPKNPETRGKLDQVLAEEDKVLNILGKELEYETEVLEFDPFGL